MKPELTQAAMEMYESLIQSIDQAGGSGNSFSAYKLRNMTVTELISELAQNNIRFTCIKKAAPKEDPIDPEEDYEGRRK